jgi:hypothetical protein
VFVANSTYYYAEKAPKLLTAWKRHDMLDTEKCPLPKAAMGFLQKI